MQKYAKIISEKTKEVQIGIGCTDEYYIEIGMKLMDVEQAYNNLWYVKGYAPQESEEEQKEKIRGIRNLYIEMYDWTQLPDVNLTAKEKTTYAEYRQYLRDYTNIEDWWKQNPKTFEEWINK